jgi:rhodanese-related sulfurtransferase
MFGFGPRVIELTPHAVRDGLARGEFALVDVREHAEHAAERIEGAILSPLSRFDPAALPHDGRKVVLHCAAGRRSATAAAACRKAGVPIAGHLQGGLAAWKRAGLPTVAGPAR